MPSCALCPMAGSPVLRPDGRGTNGVMIVSDHLTDVDKVGGRALVGRDGAMLARQLSRLGWKWDDFYCAVAAFCHHSPARATQAANSCLHFEAHCRTVKPRVYLTVGERAFTRLTGQRVPPLLARGYVWPALDGAWVVAALPPAYYRQDLGMLTTFLSDASKAVRIAEDGFAYDESPHSVWEPSVGEWAEYVREFLADPTRPLAADIETPYKAKADMTEEELAGDDMTFTINEVNLCYDGVTGVSVPWDVRYQAGVKAMLAASQAHGTTLFWNGSYDIPRLEHNGVPRFDPRHTRDVMDSFRVWRNSVRRKLVVATSLLPSSWNLRPWKHLGTASPVYRAYDVISLWRNDKDILQLLADEGQLPAFNLFMRDLGPLLDYMTTPGLRVDPERVTALDAEARSMIADVQAAMTACVPVSLLGTQVWVKRSSAELRLARLKSAAEVLPDAELFAVPAMKRVRECSACGAVGVTAEHVKRRTIKPPLDAAPPPVLE